jgi:molecular chaperone GrpE (heat shock protein)
MSERKAPRPAIIPFLIGDLLLLLAAGGIVYQSPWPMSPAYIALCVAAVALGAWLLVMPFILQYRADLKLAEADALSSTVAQIKNLQQIKEQITGATDSWQNIQGECARTAAAAKEVAAGITAEAGAFKEFLQKTNDSEKATLRLEVDKRQRMEKEWVQVTAHLLDHVFALHQGALQSGQPALIERIGQFQFACRDAVRRVGLVPLEVQPGDAFEAEAHQVLGGVKPADGVKVEQMLAPGLKLQGRLLRPVLVKVSEAGAVGTSLAAEPVSPTPANTPPEPGTGTLLAAGQPDLL